MNHNYEKSGAVEVKDKQQLCKVIAAELNAPSKVDCSLFYTTRNADGSSHPNVQKSNAKAISVGIVNRITLLCPSYEWIRKSVTMTPSMSNIRNGFICSADDKDISSTKRILCGGSLNVSIIRLSGGNVNVLVELKHQFPHTHTASAAYSSTATVQGPLKTITPSLSVNVPKAAHSAAPKVKAKTTTKATSVVVKDLLRALGKRPRTPERVKKTKTVMSHLLKGLDERALDAKLIGTGY